MSEVLNPEVTDQYDYLVLNKELDKVKSRVFVGRRAAFFGPLMSTMPFYWDTGIETACTDGAAIWWNPQFFIDAPTKYCEPTFNEFVLRHELWHAAKLHMLRMGDRDPKLWNYACDCRINADSKMEGYSWGTFPAWYMPDLDKGIPGGMVEEDIYDHLFKMGFQVPESPWGNDEFKEPKPETFRKQINNVVRAKTNAEIEKKEDEIPGNTQKLLDHFLAPIIPWEQVLLRWHLELSRGSHSWRRPRRRTMPMDIYLPSRSEDEGRLSHLMYMQDVSGSISEPEILRFNSELKYVWDYIKPKKMTVVQFDTIIQKVDVYNVGDNFDMIEIIGRGGNDMECVRRYINEHKPTAAIIFTDLQYTPMQPLDIDIPVVWIVNNRTMNPPYGECIRIDVKQPRPFR